LGITNTDGNAWVVSAEEPDGLRIERNSIDGCGVVTWQDKPRMIARIKEDGDVEIDPRFTPSEAAAFSLGVAWNLMQVLLRRHGQKNEFWAAVQRMIGQ
jgi:hypothetical protein